MPQAITDIIDKIRNALVFGDRDNPAKDFLPKIQPTFVSNDKTNPVNVSSVGPTTFAKGGDVAVTDNKGGFTIKAQTIIAKSSSKDGTSVTAGTGILLHTVTTGKKFYLTGLSLGASIDNGFELNDGGVAGTLVYAAVRVANSGVEQNFTTPIEFSTDVFLDVSVTNASVRWALSGWEE